MDRPQKTEEPAVQVVGFHVEGTQVPVPQGSEKATHGEEVTQNSSSVPYLPPALSVRKLTINVIRISWSRSTGYSVRFPSLASWLCSGLQSDLILTAIGSFILAMIALALDSVGIGPA